MDALALPMLGVTIVVFMIYIWNSWLRNKDDRAIVLSDEDDDPPMSEGR